MMPIQKGNLCLLAWIDPEILVFCDVAYLPGSVYEIPRLQCMGKDRITGPS